MCLTSLRKVNNLMTTGIAITMDTGAYEGDDDDDDDDDDNDEFQFAQPRLISQGGREGEHCAVSSCYNPQTITLLPWTPKYLFYEWVIIITSTSHYIRYHGNTCYIML